MAGTWSLDLDRRRAGPFQRGYNPVHLQWAAEAGVNVPNVRDERVSREKTEIRKAQDAGRGGVASEQGHPEAGLFR